MNGPTEFPNLPLEIISEVLSYLNPAELCNTEMVSKEWLVLTKDLWKRLCLEAPNGLGSVPYNGSWKQRFIILNNWNTKNYQVNKFNTCHKREFCIADGMHFEIYISNGEQIFRNVSKGTTKSVILYDYIGDSKIVATCICESKWICLSEDGVILCFNFSTGEFLNRVDTNTQGYLSENPILRDHIF